MLSSFCKEEQGLPALGNLPRCLVQKNNFLEQLFLSHCVLSIPFCYLALFTYQNSDFDKFPSVNKAWGTERLSSVPKRRLP